MMYKIYAKLDDSLLEDYTIIIIETEEGVLYKLQYSGTSWSDDYQGKICLEIENTGNGYKFNKIRKDMGYDDASQVFILMKFINWYEKEYRGSSLYDGCIKEVIETQTIEL